MWARDGKEILYLDNHSRITSMEATAHSDGIELGKPQVLAPEQPGMFEVSTDGKPLLMMQPPVENSSNLTLVVNWPQELKK